jgi:rSAM/selenodomain-associated transferase 2
MTAPILLRHMPSSISVVVPVLHEAPIIQGLIRHLTSLPFNGRLEILVVDGDPSRDTLAVIPAPQIQKISSPRGRGIQMNAGARAASGEILLFLHADTFLPEDGLQGIQRAMSASDAVGGAFDLSIDSPRPWFRWIERAASLRSRITRVPYGDQAIFIRRECFWEIGGYRPFPIMEDVDLMQRIRRRGLDIAMLRARVRTSARRWEKTGVCRNTLRNWMLVVLFLFGSPPQRLQRFYR